MFHELDSRVKKGGLFAYNAQLRESNVSPVSPWARCQHMMFIFLGRSMPTAVVSLTGTPVVGVQLDARFGTHDGCRYI